MKYYVTFYYETVQRLARQRMMGLGDRIIEFDHDLNTEEGIKALKAYLIEDVAKMCRSSKEDTTVVPLREKELHENH